MVAPAESAHPTVDCDDLNQLPAQPDNIDLTSLSPIFAELVEADRRLQETLEEFNEVCRQLPRSWHEVLRDRIRSYVKRLCGQAVHPPKGFGHGVATDVELSKTPEGNV